MATRSRTALFVQLRQSNPRRSSTARGPPVLESEKVGLIADDATQGGGFDDGSGSHAHAKDLPPVWVDTVEEIESTIERIQHQLNHLDALHKKHLLPGFDDRADTSVAIEQATSAVTTMFRQCQKQIKQFEAAPRSQRAPGQAPLSPQELKLHKNVASSLATRVSALSTQFRKGQSNYMARLKSRAVKSSPLFSLSDTEDDPTSLDPSARPSAFTQSQLTQVDQNEQVIRQREQEVEAIAKTIGEIAELFRDMQTMVVEQGSLLDRIDYNLTVAASNVERGNEELERASGHQVAARKKMLIFLLCLGILFVIILLAIRRRGAK
ncbi:t-SNARE [Catenaria anguillulae PL171]|uniref:t-SNARE n=1 Tax=Catenaria anguillulae PL171 TaxID=765915 RepID=A0A1Y2HGH0_9FUNG|nr:t-SNARE [Catenaria anguillulae PL171]